jgi:hypothetical protein
VEKCLRACVAAAIVTLAPMMMASPIDAQTDPSIAHRLFRLFLHDGSMVTSYGEYARVGDRVVFSVPLGPLDSEPPPLQIVSLPGDRIDWVKTDAYARSVRASLYTATRAEQDYAQLTNEVATALNDIANAGDAATRLALAERVRPLIARWPGDHFGYRAQDVREILALLDEVIAELRAQTGGDRFDLALSAGVPDAPLLRPLLPPPTLQEAIAQALTVARVTDTVEDRLALYGAASRVLDGETVGSSPEWAASTRESIRTALAVELSLERQYGALASKSLTAAGRLAAAADVRGLERLVRQVTEQDAELGGRRPEAMRGLLATIAAKLDAARRLRLARDQWALRLGELRGYRARISGWLQALRRSRGELEDIRAMAGPEVGALDRLDARLTGLTGLLQGVTAPAELASTHAMVLSAHQLATAAVRLRRAAVVANEMSAARDASSAAAGALMLAERARGELEQALKPPELP